MSAVRRAYRLVLLCLLLNLPSLTTAQPGPATADLQIAVQSDGLQLSWQGRLHRDRAGTPQLSGWPLVEFGGVRLPARLLALDVDRSTQIMPRLEQLTAAPWSGPLAQVAAPVPQPSPGLLRPALAAVSSADLPDAPIVVLRDGLMRGRRVVVLAISPLFSAPDGLRAATSLTAIIPGARLFAADPSALLADSAPFGTTPPASNPGATVHSWTVEVTAAGMQRVTGAQLAAAGLDLVALDPVRLHVRAAGVDQALDLRGTADGRLDPADELRFYAPSAGDRWNATTRYWLTVEAEPGSRMARRSVLPGQAPLSTIAQESGGSSGTALYDSTLPGPDGDHWFAADLRTGPGQSAASYTVALSSRLPLASGPTIVTLSGSAYTAGQHLLTLQLGAATATARWSGAGNWTHSFTLDSPAATLQISLVPGAAPDGVELDQIRWQRRVALDAANQGAIFGALPGVSRYEIANTAAERTLYDIGDPSAPVLLTLPPQLTSQFQFQDDQPGRTYLLDGPGALHTPTVRPHTPVDLRAPLDADVLYIAPAEFGEALAPLVAHRAAQGHRVRQIDVEAIYATWSYGQIAPEAIRAFLQHAAAGERAPQTVTLVGDGTSDPRNYTGRNNATVIPPYLALVDPWLGETACEFCYAQLDGADPRSDPLPDLALGRLPVKSAAELRALVAKIIGYETSSGGIDWRSRALYVADNADSAGDFAAHADASAALQPAGVAIERMYYDPSATAVGLPWREPDAARAHQRTLDALNTGAGLVSYFGHSHQWQWAVTDPATPPGMLLGLYDTDTLRNAGRLPIVLEMTCFTSAFQQPAYSGTTLDERLVLHPGGGAIATWGPTGLGVAHGHDALQRGFLGALWRAPRMSARLGALTLAGGLELFTTGGCCQDTIQTFALLGDPLTAARVLPATRSYLPLARR